MKHKEGWQMFFCLVLVFGVAPFVYHHTLWKLIPWLMQP